MRISALTQDLPVSQLQCSLDDVLLDFHSSQRVVKMVKTSTSFYFGFLVGTCSLYMVLQQGWYSHPYFYPRPNDTALRRLEDEHKNWKKERSALFNLNHPHHIGEDSSLSDSLYKSVRILCWVMTGPSNLETKARHVKATWSRHCNIVVFMSSVDDPDFPTVGLNTKEGRDQLYWKTIRAFHYVMEKHGTEADWFLKADDDTYTVVDNLRWVLANHSPDEPVYFGRRFKPYMKQGYMSGGAGYVLSREALKRFVEGFRTKTCTHTSSVEDLALGQCMEKVGVAAGDSRDTLQRETFHPFVPEQHLTAKFPKSFWYWNYCYYPIVEVKTTQIPHHTDANTIPHHTDANTIPHHTDANTIPHHTDANTIPHHTDANTIPHHTDANTIPHHTDANTIPHHTDA
ncbi:glycoprotein-N-acetylgalactosamine 3-beta-galactosyltransferase 1-B, partial [Tachysurus ichikawai]